MSPSFSWVALRVTAPFPRPVHFVRERLGVVARPVLERGARTGLSVPTRRATVLVSLVIEGGRARAAQPRAAGAIVARRLVAPTVEIAPTLA